MAPVTASSSASSSSEPIRWLVVGPYPPERGSGPEAAAAFVAARLVAGDSVHAVSPRPTAAHVHHPLDGWRGLRELWRIARAERATGLWLRVESGIVLRAGVDRRLAIAERAALALFLRRFATSILDVGDVGLLPGGRAGRPVLASTSRFVVHREGDADALLASGASPDRIERQVVDPGAPGGTPAGLAVPVAGADAPPLQIDPAGYPPPVALQGLPAERAAIEAAVVERAAQLRAARVVATGALDDATGPSAG